ARRLGIPCTVIAPDTAPMTKVRAVERLGGRVLSVPFDRWWQTFSDRGYPGIDGAFVHPFDDERVMAGNGTIGLELLEELPGVDTVLIPWGGGGLAVGIATALRALKPSVRIYAVEVETGAPLAASWKAGSAQVVEYRPSFVDGIGSKTVFSNMLAMAKELLDGTFTASVDEIAAALKLMAERNRVIAEGAGAVRSADELDETVSAVRAAGRRGEAILCDVTERPNVDAMVARVKAALGNPLILVNNAGAAASAKLSDTTDEMWDHMLRVNAT